MKLLRTGLAALAFAVLPAAEALAWTVDTDDEFAYAVQAEATGKFWLVLACDFEFTEYSIAVETDEKWEESTSYAPEVPTTLVVNGNTLTTDAFRFVQRGDIVAVELFEYNDSAAFDTVYDALYAATGDIAVSFFDKSVRFAAEDIAAAFDAVDLACW